MSPNRAADEVRRVAVAKLRMTDGSRARAFLQTTYLDGKTAYRSESRTAKEPEVRF
jgi:hypothetical protein